MSYVFGGDPGASGGLVRIGHTGDMREAVRFKGKDAEQIWIGVRALVCTHQAPAYVELLQSFGDVNAKKLPRLFQMRENAGVLQGLLTAAGCRVIKVLPTTWKYEFSLVGVGDTYEERKKAAHAIAKEEFGNWVTKDIADAMLIAEFGWRKENGKLTGGKKQNGVLRPGTGITRVTGVCTECKREYAACICI